MPLYERSLSSEEDWRKIVTYTFDKHGEAQVHKYTQSLLKGMEAMAKGEGHYKDINVSRYTIRVKHCQKHYIFGMVRKNTPMLIVAIFHEKMELIKQLRKRL